MKRNLWALITLESYKRLGDMCEALDMTVDAIIKQAYDGRKDAYLIMQKIQDINYRKAGLINLKIVFEQTIKKLKDKEKTLLFNIFCKGKKIDKYAVENEFCVRTLRRRFNSAVKHFADLLKSGGFNENWFEENYSNEPYITLIGEQVKDRQAHIQNMCKCEKDYDKNLKKSGSELEGKVIEERGNNKNDCLVNDSESRSDDKNKGELHKSLNSENYNMSELGSIEKSELEKDNYTDNYHIRKSENTVSEAEENDEKSKLITILQEAVIKVNNKVAN